MKYNKIISFVNDFIFKKTFKSPYTIHDQMINVEELINKMFI